MTALYRRAAKRDTAEGPIVAALQAHGFTVAALSIADGPDLLLGRHGITRVAEVKTGAAKLRPGQAAWWTRWRGNDLIVLRSVEDVAHLARTWTDADTAQAA